MASCNSSSSSSPFGLLLALPHLSAMHLPSTVTTEWNDLALAMGGAGPVYSLSVTATTLSASATESRGLPGGGFWPPL